MWSGSVTTKPFADARVADLDATRLRAHDGLPTMDRSETEHAALERLLFVICLVLLAVIVGGMFLR
jgi:hypothetical protein